MSPKEWKAYEDYMETLMYQDSVLGAARRDGRIEGRAEARAEIEREATLAMIERMKALGMDEETISKITGYPQ